MTQRSPGRAVLAGGTIAGALDIAFALSFAAANGVLPLQLLQTVASGLLGPAAYSGAAAVAGLGLACHFALSYLWAAVFAGAAIWKPRLLDRPLVAGVVFGVLVFFTMRLVVLPLSAYPHPVSFRPVAATLDLLSHMLLFGFPIAAAARRYLQRREAPSI